MHNIDHFFSRKVSNKLSLCFRVGNWPVSMNKYKYNLLLVSCRTCTCQPLGVAPCTSECLRMPWCPDSWWGPTASSETHNTPPEPKRGKSMSYLMVLFFLNFHTYFRYFLNHHCYSLLECREQFKYYWTQNCSLLQAMKNNDDNLMLLFTAGSCNNNNKLF